MSSLEVSAAAGSHIWFQSITFERMHQFHSKFTEGQSIIKYRPTSNLEINLFDFVFG